jgi:hypothetical protein
MQCRALNIVVAQCYNPLTAGAYRTNASMCSQRFERSCFLDNQYFPSSIHHSTTTNMPHLPSFMEMIGKGQKPKDHVSDRSSVDFNTAGSFASWSNTDVNDGRPSIDTASSIYLHRTSSACAQTVLKVKHTPCQREPSPGLMVLSTTPMDTPLTWLINH